jgi:hypothetical protein
MAAFFLGNVYWIVIVGVALLFVLFGEIGFGYGRRRAEHTGDDAPLGVTLAAAYGVVALLLGFSFQLAINRFDARRETLVNEANAIGTTILRTRLFDEATGAALRAKLHDYVDTRIEFSAAGANANAREAAGERTTRLQNELWALAMTAVRRDPRSTLSPLFVQTLNEMIDMSLKEEAVLNAVIPTPILIVLLIVVLAAATLLGIDFGRKGKRAPVVTLVFAIMIVLVVAIIFDLDLPQRGLIRIDLAPLRALYQLF